MTRELSNLLQTLIQALGWSLVHFVWQGFVIAIVLAMMLLVTRKAKAQWRYAIACAALLSCAALPAWKFVQALERGTNIEVVFQTTAQVSSPTLEAHPLIQVGNIIQTNLHWIVLCWALVVCLLSIRLFLGLWWLQGYGSGQRGQVNSYWQAQLDDLAQQFALPGRVLLRVVKDIDSPLTIGWLRPMVLVPASLVTGMEPSYLQALLAHELAHIRRHDYLINLIQNLIEMILFFHPAVWWISKKIRNERENIADDLAASMLGEPRRLALALQELELLQFTTPQLAQAAHGGNLMSRIKRLIRPEVQSINWKTAVSVVSIATVCVGFAANAAIPALSSHSRSTLPNQVVAISNENATDSDVESSPLIASEFLEQASEVKAGVNVPKSKTSINKDGVTKARIDFEKPGCRPEYPREALSKEATGVTTLAIATSAKGRIEKVRVLKSSGHESLDNAVRNQLLSGKCTQNPGMINGKPQATITQVQYVWKLD
ncbi:TonB family protein [Undibacterium danionis]|uniref:TonB family protein n=1 Tax=Undibacterium danionis TaxID=1812100 RepID=A0ABV6IJW4_9BURK